MARSKAALASEILQLKKENGTLFFKPTSNEEGDVCIYLSDGSKDDIESALRKKGITRDELNKHGFLETSGGFGAAVNITRVRNAAEQYVAGGVPTEDV